MLRASLFNLPNKKQEAATEKLFSDSDREEEISHSLRLWHLEACWNGAGGGRGASLRQRSLFSYQGVCLCRV